MQTDAQGHVSGNGKRCSCGLHEGVGYFPDNTALTAADRAARYKRLRDKLPQFFTPMMRDYLADYEQHHGTVDYELVEKGKASGLYLTKGQPLHCVVSRFQDQQELIPAVQKHWADT